MFLVDPLHNRLLQVSVFASIVYYLTASPLIFDKARKMFPIKFKKVHHQLLFHTFVFGVLMYLLTYFVFDPALKVFEGYGKATGDCGRSVNSKNEEDKICEEGMWCMVNAGWSQCMECDSTSPFNPCEGLEEDTTGNR